MVFRLAHLSFIFLTLQPGVLPPGLPPEDPRAPRCSEGHSGARRKDPTLWTLAILDARPRPVGDPVRRLLSLTTRADTTPRAAGDAQADRLGPLALHDANEAGDVTPTSTTGTPEVLHPPPSPGPPARNHPALLLLQVDSTPDLVHPHPSTPTLQITPGLSVYYLDPGDGGVTGTDEG